MKKALKIISAIVGVILLVFIIVIANALVGNPVSKYLANKTAEEYIASTYPNNDFIVEDAFYSFKDSRYHIAVSSPSSVDTVFSLDINQTGKLISDTYESSVLEGFNTYRRLALDYRELYDNATQNESFSFTLDEINYASIMHYSEIDYPNGLKIEDLEIDKVYDMKELGAQYGEVILYIRSNDLSAEQASEAILEFKEILDENGFKFAYLDFVIRLPQGSEDEFERSFNARGLTYEELSADTLIQRVQELNDLSLIEDDEFSK